MQQPASPSCTANCDPAGLPSWDSGAETAHDNPHGSAFTLFKLPPTLSGSSTQQYADACAAYGLQAIGCFGSFIGLAHPGISEVRPAGMGMPESWGCDIAKSLYEETGWADVVFLDYGDGGLCHMCMVGDRGGCCGGVADPRSPVCALTGHHAHQEGGLPSESGVHRWPCAGCGSSTAPGGH